MSKYKVAVSENLASKPFLGWYLIANRNSEIVRVEAGQVAGSEVSANMAP